MSERLPDLKQTPEAAASIAENFGPAVNVAFREGLLAQIESEETSNGPLSLEFIQGLFSGAVLAERLVTQIFQKDPQRCLQLLAISMAQIYSARVEQEVRNSIPKPD